MKKRNALTIALSLIIVLMALGTLLYWKNAKSASEFTPTGAVTPSVSQTRPPAASTRTADELLLVLRSKSVPFTYAFVLASEGCFIGRGEPCSYSERYPFSEELYASLSGNVVSWFSDGENGLVDYGGAILSLNYAQRKSQVYKTDFLKTNSGLHPSPDMRWLGESVQNDDPYRSDLVLINIQSGEMEKLNILPDCFKDPIGWLDATKLLFRCDKSEGQSSKKNRVSSEMFTVDIATRQVEAFEAQYDWMNARAVLSLSPDGKSVVLNTITDGRVSTLIEAPDGGQSTSLDIVADAALWTQDSSELALYDQAGKIYFVGRDGSGLKQAHQLDPAGGYADLAWLPSGSALLVSQYTNQEINQTRLFSIALNGEVKQIVENLVTAGYVVCGISPLPKLAK